MVVVALTGTATQTEEKKREIKKRRAARLKKQNNKKKQERRSVRSQRAHDRSSHVRFTFSRSHKPPRTPCSARSSRKRRVTHTHTAYHSLISTPRCQVFRKRGCLILAAGLSCAFCCDFTPSDHPQKRAVPSHTKNAFPKEPAALLFYLIHLF